jgi:hypothetical protein
MLTQINARQRCGRHPYTHVIDIRPVEGSIVRLARRWLAALMILGFASAQFISLAHACMNAKDTVHIAVDQLASQATHAMPPDCPAMAQGGGAAHSACEAQCLPREQADRAADVRVALAPPSVLVVRPATLAVPSALRAMPPRVTIASPPLSLLFSRFLI